MKLQNTMHSVHFIMTILTMGLWLPCWAFCILQNAAHNGIVRRQREEQSYMDGCSTEDKRRYL